MYGVFENDVTLCILAGKGFVRILFDSCAKA